MKKVLLWLLLCVFLCIQSVFAVPAKDPYSLKLCKVILNPNAVDGYQLIVFNEDGRNPKIVEEDTCVEWVLYLLPKEIDLDDIEIKKVEKEDFYDGICRKKVQKRDVVNLWAIRVWKLESRCAHIDECSSWCHHPNSSPSWTDRVRIEYNKDYGKKYDELDSQYKIDLSKQKYVLKLYMWVDRIDEKNLKIDKFKARNDESWEWIPVIDIYDERDIPWSLPEDNRSTLEQYISLNHKFISQIFLLTGAIIVVILFICVYFKKKKK